ncbi:hypothetical protein KP509_26G062800 [Ceratopteris richardii]|uniref:Glycosyltransferase n=1 Tax=Ceratopteris richardii TaxID=49495 RepID=A0A8T2RLB1_CERRI|nr:hypothetical protein KP509_26G062800 [Ceratopteris richardii]
MSSLANGSSMTKSPHALMFPYPAQGHINPMMQLARRLITEGGFFITFVNTDHNHQRMFGKLVSEEPVIDSDSPNLRFVHMPDGLPEHHKRFNEKPNGVQETTAAILSLPGELTRLVHRVINGSEVQPLTCIIADAFCSWVQEVANIFALPRVSLWTTPVHANLAYTFQELLQSRDLIPVTDNSKLDQVVNCIKGIVPMKLEDYISFFLVDSTSDFLYQWHLRLCMRRPQEAAWNLGNNFEELEQEACLAFKESVPNFITVGPLLPDYVFCDDPQTCASSGGVMSLWPEDGSCNQWLSQQERGSVIYISFGSVVNMSEEELSELVKGLEESGAPFLWAVRPDQGGAVLSDLRKRLDAEAAQGVPSRRALLVSWAPQLAVLNHSSVGLFLSHCGWNSLVESLAAGVPLLAKPGGFAEQRMNAHYIEEAWKIGRRVPSGASAGLVKALVSSMLGKSPERERTLALRKAAAEAVRTRGGTSASNLQLFIDDMRRRAGAGALHVPI